MKRWTDQGATLIELLAALTISAMIIGLIGIFLRMEEGAWNAVIPRNMLNTSLSFAEQKLQDEFQNLVPQSVSIDNTNGHLSAKDVNGNTVDIYVASGANGLDGITIQTTTTSGGTTSSVITSPEISFAGTSFNSTNQTSVGATFTVTYVGGTAGSSEPSQTLTTTLIAGGGF